MNSQWDCVIIGGGAAGLSAALVLGRARRRTLVIDAGSQSNLAAHGIGGLLGYDGTPPRQFYDQGRAELDRYPSVELRSGEVVAAGADLSLVLADGAGEHGRTVLLAMGMDYQVPPIPGINELWGNAVFHCPFCHGWEARDQPLAVLGHNERAVHSALLLRNWSDDVIVLNDGAGALSAEDRDQLLAAGVQVDDRTVSRLVPEGEDLVAVEFTDGSHLPRTGALVPPTLRQRSDLTVQLGVKTAAGRIAVDAVVSDEMHRTSVPGVFAAGDVSARMPQVAAAVAEGSVAAAAILQTLLAGENRDALDVMGERERVEHP